ncbi:MAG TPA: hypoxanthine phosphoribosyltransferase [Rhabdochlamydiaceae bacterium]|nr:hypoxanthine phosphoribosyltransferase [Rhabdochlamydiaceae bacterium]
MKKLALFSLCVSSLCFGNESLELLISPEDIKEKIQQTAKKLDAEYDNEEVTVVMVMKGAVCLAADLIRELHVPAALEYMKASSYGGRMDRGELKITGIDHLDLNGKNVLVVDDIFDSGATMEGVLAKLQEKNPKSLKSLVLLMKNVPHATTYRPDYVLFEIEDRFVIGYGLDFNEYYRGLPGVYAFKN